jgi:hypothetical protein
VTALVADEVMAHRLLLGWLAPDGDSLVTISAVEVEGIGWYELPRKWRADAADSSELSMSWWAC